MVVNNSLTVSSTNAITLYTTTATSCGTNLLGVVTKGGYAAVVGNNKCTNPWWSATSAYAVDPSGATTNM